MAVYVGVSVLYGRISQIIERVDVLLPPPTLKILEFAEKELKSFRNFVERLDSKSRERMSASLERIFDTLAAYIEEDSLIYGDYDNILDEKRYDDLSSGIHSLKEVVSKSKMVGLYDQRRLLKDNLVDPRADTIIYTIVGMAGIGKTTLIREIFEDLDIIEWFECRVWVTAGFEWREGEEATSQDITGDILAQVDPNLQKMVMGGSMEEKSEALKESLRGKRYLIVLDDVWNQSVDEYLESSLPNNLNGSHVVLTTRLKLVGLDGNRRNFIDMRFLDKEESWDLLRQKVFVGVSCPPHLEDAGKKIAEKCDGLPLTIVTIADLLSKVPESLWIDVATKRKHKLFVDAYDQISQVLNPSYEILHDFFKNRFLYMGVFPLKHEIPQSRLINFFYEPQIKTCGLHSTWWHFCQTKARETNLFHVLDCYNKNDIEEAIEGHTRLSIHNNVLFALKHVYNSIEKICASTARSLLCFGPYCQYMVPVCFGLKFLRGLVALNIRFYDFSSEVLQMVKLRYLALTCNGNLPSSISDLRKFQYLIVHPHFSIKPCGALFNLPMEIWDMKRLKHLQVKGYDLPNLGDTSLQELITLSDVTTHSCMIFNRVLNLKKLGIKIELSPNAIDPLCCFDHISHLTKLKSFKCVIVNLEFKLGVVSPVSSFPCFSFSLKKLSLSGMGYPWEEMSKIASLPNLKVLKLRFNTFRGPKWELEENGFPNLRVLLIEDIDLVKLKWAHGIFKSLIVLKIKHCYKLVELHLGPHLKIVEIEVIDCSPLTEWHVKNNARKYSNWLEQWEND
ncbi:hypothetical protein ACS0TY_025670 [Phlomoides rotata]